MNTTTPELNSLQFKFQGKQKPKKKKGGLVCNPPKKIFYTYRDIRYTMLNCLVKKKKEFSGTSKSYLKKKKKYLGFIKTEISFMITYYWQQFTMLSGFSRFQTA